MLGILELLSVRMAWPNNYLFIMSQKWKGRALRREVVLYQTFQVTRFLQYKVLLIWDEIFSMPQWKWYHSTVSLFWFWMPLMWSTLCILLDHENYIILFTLFVVSNCSIYKCSWDSFVRYTSMVTSNPTKVDGTLKNICTFWPLL